MAKYDKQEVNEHLKVLKEICDQHKENCLCYDNGEDTSCPLYEHCDDVYGLMYPCNLRLEEEV